MNRKQKKMLARILTAAAMLIALKLIPVTGVLQLALYLVAYLVIGYDILRKAGKGILNGRAFDENFLMTLATLGAFFLAIWTKSGDYVEGIAVMLFYQIGELFQSYAVGKSRRNITALILVSCILGIGAGMVIPFSTGLVVDYFTGDYRVRQLGYSSSINNLTLVLATVVTGYLANVDWHLPFLVYTLPGISLALSFLLKRQRSVPEPEQSIQLRHKMIDRRKLAGLMAFYFFVTYAVLVVTFYASFLIDDYKIDSSFSGVLISLFFLAIMLPGLFIANIIRSLKRNVNLVALVLVCVGLLCVGVFHGKAMLAFGALCTGLGYGIMQPVIYDKAATIAPPRSATLALSFVMSVNYLAVMVCPFIVDLFRHVFGTHSDRFPFFFNAVLVLAVAVVTLLRRDSFTLGLDESYYRN